MTSDVQAGLHAAVTDPRDEAPLPIFEGERDDAIPVAPADVDDLGHRGRADAPRSPGADGVRSEMLPAAGGQAAPPSEQVTDDRDIHGASPAERSAGDIVHGDDSDDDGTTRTDEQHAPDPDTPAEDPKTHDGDAVADTAPGDTAAVHTDETHSDRI